MEQLNNFMRNVRDGDMVSQQGIFVEAPHVDDPQRGRIVGAEMMIFYGQQLQGRLAESDITDIATTQTEAMTVVEQVVEFQLDGRSVPLPIALAGERRGDQYSCVRIYYSTWPLTGRHRLRQPLLLEDRSIVLPDVIGRYHNALAGGDLGGMLALFDDDGYAREPSGGKWVYRGKQRLREFYSLLFSNGGGIRLQHCSYTDDGVRGALEYNAAGWGRTGLKPQAGIAVYERGPRGLLHAARIYDDVTPPVPEAEV